MKISYRRGMQRLLMAAVFALGVAQPWFMVEAVSADDETLSASESLESATEIAAVAQVDQQNTDGATFDAAPLGAAPGEDFDEDPWEGFNEKMFWFNREIFDRYVLKPAATAWDFVLPDPVQRGVHNFFDNLGVVRRVVNNTLQLKLTGAGVELTRFTINSTIGVAGFFDVAKDFFGLEQRDEDLGQTFGVWGMRQGPYVVLPLLPPLTVRDGIGYALDIAMTPYVYFIPWYASIGGRATDIVNERSLNLDRFERVAESTVDLYGAVRNAYLQRRAAAVKQ
ncbi:MAG TPA: VacJ family lipoprotein [Candidatus Binatia bacterium]|nr:VacJ family lipoprotein [Candidatus Binatia bacterium]